MAVSAVFGFVIARAFNYDSSNYEAFGSFRTRTGRAHKGIRDMHEFLEQFPDGLIITIIVLLFIAAIGCFLTLPMLLLRRQRLSERGRARE
ncbi:MAG: hypothetical protein ACTHXA_14130 [Gulosibacter sp.]|uniref:hypothetical protein n=1 Tax=Gulosibacter sp. TaxID=2817531 RepID=UPI003F93D04C